MIAFDAHKATAKVAYSLKRDELDLDLQAS
jgi:hypothetical protein